MKNYWIKTFRRLAAASVVAGSTMFYSAMCYAITAADSATDPMYADGWQAGDNGGTGFGAWSFNGTDPTPAGTYQTMSSTSPIGTSWTLATHSDTTGLANAGRAITGGLLPGQTFETVIDNPTEYHFYRGFDILFTSGPDNNGAGNNAAALRLSVFNYFASDWSVTVAGGGTGTGLSSLTTAAAGVKIDLTLTSATAYSLTLTPLNGDPAYTHAGTLAGSISWVDYRLWDGTSTAPEDTAHNFEISNMSIVPAGVPGDYNSDGVVDAADYTVWRDHLGTSFSLPNEVASVTPGMVTQEDYTAWRDRFGNTSGAGSASKLSAVPEPSGFGLLIAAITSFLTAGLRPMMRLNPWRAIK